MAIAMGAQAQAVDPFAPPAGGWTRVSPQLMTVRRTVVSIVLGGVTVLLAGLAAFVDGAVSLVVVAIGFVVWLWGWRLIGQQWRALGYAESVEDLLIVRGVLFRELVVVPYGRMQFVDVTAGPLDAEAAHGLGRH